MKINCKKTSELKDTLASDSEQEAVKDSIDTKISTNIIAEKKMSVLYCILHNSSTIFL